MPFNDDGYDPPESYHDYYERRIQEGNPIRHITPRQGAPESFTMLTLNAQQALDALANHHQVTALGPDTVARIDLLAATLRRAVTAMSKEAF